jgi:hypothetical protein
MMDRDCLTLKRERHLPFIDFVPLDLSNIIEKGPVWINLFLSLCKTSLGMLHLAYLHLAQFNC